MSALAELSRIGRDEMDLLHLVRVVRDAGFEIQGPISRKLARRLQSRGFVELFVPDHGDERIRLTSLGAEFLLKGKAA